MGITWESLGISDVDRMTQRQGLFGCNRVLAATQRSMGRKTQRQLTEAHPGTLIATDASTVAAWRVRMEFETIRLQHSSTELNRFR